jgi:WD40 repeat protein
MSATLRTVAAAGISGRVPALAETTVKGMRSQKLHVVGTIAALATVAVAGVVGGAGKPAAPEARKQTESNSAAPGGKVQASADLFGDPLPPDALARLGTTRLRHGAKLTQVGFSADGKSLITAGQDGYVRVWDTSTGKELRRLGREIPPGSRPGFDERVLGGLRVEQHMGGYARIGVVFSGDGGSAALAEPDGTVGVWDLATGQERCHLSAIPNQGNVFGLGLSFDGKRLVSRGKDGTLVLWDTDGGKELQRLPATSNPAARQKIYFGVGGESVENYVFSPDGKCLATLDVNEDAKSVVQVWDLAAGKELGRVSGDNLGLNPPAFTRNGQTLVRLAGDRSVRFHDVSSGKEVRRISEARPGLSPTWAALAPEGRFYAVQTAEGVALLYDLEIGKVVRQLGQKGVARYGSGSCTAIAFSPDGKTMAQGVAFNTVRLWDLASGKVREWTRDGHGGALATVAISPDGKVVTTAASDDTVRVWDATTGKERRHFPVAGGDAGTLSADGRLLAVPAAGVMHLWDVEGGKEVRSFRPANQAPNVPVLSARFSPDGRRVAVASFGVQARNSWAVHVWDVADGRERQHVVGEVWLGNFPATFDRYLADYALSPDGAFLLTLASEPVATKPGAPPATVFVLRLWDVATGDELWKAEAEEAFRAGIFSPDGRVVVAATTEQIVVFEVASGKERTHFKAPAWGLAASPDGRLLATAERSGVGLWDVERGEAVGRLTGHQAHVAALTFTPDGKALVTGSADSTALVWDMSRFAPHPRSAELNAQQVEALWDDLASNDAGKAFRAIALLRAAPEHAVPWLKAHLKPIASPDDKQVAALISRLDNDDFAVRDEAARELEGLADSAGDTLRKVLQEQPTPEVRRRLKALLAVHLPGKAFPPKQLRLVRAVEVLERAATPDARALLEKLAKGAPGARLTREAQAALQRLGR